MVCFEQIIVVIEWWVKLTSFIQDSLAALPGKRREKEIIKKITSASCFCGNIVLQRYLYGYIHTYILYVWYELLFLKITTLKYYHKKFYVLKYKTINTISKITFLNLLCLSQNNILSYHPSNTSSNNSITRQKTFKIHCKTSKCSYKARNKNLLRYVPISQTFTCTIYPSIIRVSDQYGIRQNSTEMLYHCLWKVIQSSRTMEHIVRVLCSLVNLNLPICWSCLAWLNDVE